MTDLQRIFEQYQQGTLDLDGLRRAVGLYAERGAEARSALAIRLHAEYSAGRLTASAYFALEPWARGGADPAAPTVVVGDALDEDRTFALGLAEATLVVGGPPDDAPTLVVGAPGNDDATLLVAAAEPTVVVGTRLDDMPSPAHAEADSPRIAPDPAGDDPTWALPLAEATLAVGNPDDATAVAGHSASPTPPPALPKHRTEATYGTQAATRAQPHPTPRADRPLQIGMMLKERFVLEEVIGGGGMGTVFKALDMRKSEARDREPYVALKVLNPEFRDNPIALIALQRETKRAQTLSHPNIINVFDFDRDGGHVFMSMEYLDGRPLNQMIRETPGGMPFKQAWPLIRAMADALGYAHSKDVVHSDFKPGNVFLDSHGEVRVLDFGIACAAGRVEKAGADATIFNARDLGALTPAYASLEMIQRQDPDPRDDLYALGCVAYELLTGKHPYGKLAADKALELNIQAKPVPGLNRKQWRGLQRAIALKREDRVASAAEFIKDLQVRTPAFYALWTLALVAAGSSGASVYFSLFAPQETPKVAVQLSEDQRQQIADLLELAAIHYEVGYLTAPTGSNALWAYQEVLKIDPYNGDAVKGLRKIADAQEQAAWQAFEQGNSAESLKKVVDGLEAVPDHPGLVALRKKLER
ncbi:Serine/threonine protein kinase [Methylomagnum ishizawai]|uniref:Serine/threonine protein kinase n=1 Tax=Methylomagnum ishizawai TaxID=1760988 RepID=A0A1Y6D9H1_9GAMM|nr:serine/threonine-protein kinase [Methylomagnum ishizawai]SMF96854.1 Serine/threonine protein kinase [Methylomagnum ishizawai]